MDQIHVHAQDEPGYWTADEAMPHLPTGNPNLADQEEVPTLNTESSDKPTQRLLPKRNPTSTPRSPRIPYT